MFIQSPRFQGSPQIIFDKFFSQVLDVDFLGSCLVRLFCDTAQLLFLPKISGNGHNIGVIFLLQPFYDDRSVEAAGIRNRNSLLLQNEVLLRLMLFIDECFSLDVARYLRNSGDLFVFRRQTPEELYQFIHLSDGGRRYKNRIVACNRAKNECVVEAVDDFRDTLRSPR